MAKSESAPIRIRRGKPESGYTSISNTLIAHPTLSPAARLAIIYLLSKPESWELRIDDLRRVLGTSGKACGRNKVYKVVKELKLHGYVISIEETREGRFQSLTYFIFDEANNRPDEFLVEVRAVAPEGSKLRVQGPVCQERAVPNILRERTSVQAPVTRIGETVSDILLELPVTGNGVAVPTPFPQKRYPGKEHNINNRKKPIPDLPLTPNIVSQRDGGKEFEKLWDLWPKCSRPDFRQAAEVTFKKLALEEQQQAVLQAEKFIRTTVSQRSRPLMLPYLKQRVFADLQNSPRMNFDRKFVVKPEHREWKLWIEHLAKTCSPDKIDKVIQSGQLLCTTLVPKCSSDHRALAS